VLKGCRFFRYFSFKVSNGYVKYHKLKLVISRLKIKIYQIKVGLRYFNFYVKYEHFKILMFHILIIQLKIKISYKSKERTQITLLKSLIIGQFTLI